MSDAPPFDPGARRAILDAVTALQPKAVELLAGLVRHRSLLGHEHSCLAAMEDIYRDLDLAPSRVAIDPGALESHPGWSPSLIGYAGREPVVAIHRRLYWNCRKLTTGKRRSHCPYELLGAPLPCMDFWTLLQTAADPLTQVVSS